MQGADAKIIIGCIFSNIILSDSHQYIGGSIKKNKKTETIFSNVRTYFLEHEFHPFTENTYSIDYNKIESVIFLNQTSSQV